MLPLKNDNVFVENFSQKKPEVFQNSIPWVVSLEKTYYIGQPIFFMNKLKIFHRLIAWLVCLDKFVKFASQFYFNSFVI